MLTQLAHRVRHRTTICIHQGLAQRVECAGIVDFIERPGRLLANSWACVFQCAGKAGQCASGLDFAKSSHRLTTNRRVWISQHADQTIDREI